MTLEIKQATRENNNEVKVPEIEDASDLTSGKVRTIIMRDLIKTKSYISICSGGVYITSGKYYNDFHLLKYKNLKNTNDLCFLISDEEMNCRELKIPDEIRKKIVEYLRNQDKLIIDERYRLPGGLKSTPFNCQSFIYFIKGWFEKKPDLEFKYLKEENIGDVKPGDTLYLIEGDEGTGEYWHYMLYLGEGFCLSKNGHAGVVITRHNLKGLYHVKEKLS
ncbi:hypothetical protein HUU51_00560 [Candidatus Gracilibacteria bacterium]|nr:hypothetical protein [Candidatus Gracilibacteria bacterium]